MLYKNSKIKTMDKEWNNQC